MSAAVECPCAECRKADALVTQVPTGGPCPECGTPMHKTEDACSCVWGCGFSFSTVAK